MTEMSTDRPAMFSRIQDGEVVYVGKDNRRQRGIHKTCQKCGDVFIVSLSSARSNPRVGTYCSASCRSKATNEKRWAKK